MRRSAVKIDQYGGVNPHTFFYKPTTTDCPNSVESRCALSSSSVGCWRPEADGDVLVRLLARRTHRCHRPPPPCPCTIPLQAASHAAAASSPSASSLSSASPSFASPSLERYLHNCLHSRYLLLLYPPSGLKTTVHTTAQSYVLCHSTGALQEGTRP